MPKILTHPLFLAGITIISIIFSISLYQSAQKTTHSTANLKSIEQEVSELEEEIINLENTIQESQEPFAKEQVIRDELLMKKAGEYVVQIPNELIEAQQPSIEINQASPWEEWRERIFTKSRK